MGNGFFLDGGVEDDALELNWLDGLDFNGGLNRGLEQLLPKPSSPIARRKRPIWVASHGNRGS
jgi:hypothetical protein